MSHEITGVLSNRFLGCQRYPTYYACAVFAKQYSHYAIAVYGRLFTTFSDFVVNKWLPPFIQPGNESLGVTQMAYLRLRAASQLST